MDVKVRLHAILLHIIFICGLGVLTGIIATARGTNLLGLFVLFICCLFFLLSCQSLDVKVRNLIILAFLLRLGLALTHAFIIPLPDSGADALAFENLGWQTAQAWLNGEFTPSLSGAYIYSLVIGALYYLFGRIPLLAQFVNVLLGTLTVYYTWKLALKISGEQRPALIAALIVALFPTLNLYSAITMRESIIVFFTVLSVYCFFLWLQHGRFSQMLSAAVLLLPAAVLHSGMVFIELVYVFFFSFYHPKRNKWILFSVNTIIALLLIIFIIGVFGDWLNDKLPQNIESLFSPDYLGERTSVAARDRAAYLTNVKPASFMDMIIQTPLRALYFLFAPFPWMVSSSADIFGLIDALLYVLLSIYAVKGLACLWHQDKISFWGIVLIMAVFLVVFAWGTSNYGTAIRHRQKMVWFLTIPAAIELAKSRWWKQIYSAKDYS